MDRRKEGERIVGDRRVIARFSDPRIATNFKSVRVWVWALMWIFFCAGLFEIAHGLYKGPEYIGPAVLACLIFWLMTAFVYRYLVALEIYLENESVNNLNTMVERLNMILLAFSFFGGFFYLAAWFWRS